MSFRIILYYSLIFQVFPVFVMGWLPRQLLDEEVKGTDVKGMHKKSLLVQRTQSKARGSVYEWSCSIIYLKAILCTQDRHVGIIIESKKEKNEPARMESLPHSSPLF